ncbi:MFS transporter (plasmid) [Sphingomonas sp. LaA6.9]|nr:MFS transporter [Sphingomonas sp. LaA6.9]
MAVAFAGPAIARAWTVDHVTLGWLFGAGLAGMTLGALFLAPLADRFGRRPVAISCLAAMALAMLASGLAANIEQLIVLRLITGLGVGGILATLNSVVAEAARPERRNLAISIFTAGYPLGSMAGGAMAVALIEHFGWQSIFFIGGAGTAIVCLLHWIWLPEANWAGMGTKLPMSTLLKGDALPRTLLISASFFLHMLSVFFVLNWSPRLVEMMGFSAQIGLTTTLIINLGGLVGGLAYGPLADCFGWRRVTMAYFLAFSPALATVGMAPGSTHLLFIIAACVGLFQGGAMTSLYALAPILFADPVRVSGTGLAIGIGRCGGILGPIAAGYLIAAGLPAESLYLMCAALPIGVAILIAALRPTNEAKAGARALA